MSPGFEMLSAATGCLFLWVMLRFLYWAEGPEMAALVGLGVIGKIAWNLLRNAD